MKEWKKDKVWKKADATTALCHHLLNVPEHAISKDTPPPVGVGVNPPLSPYLSKRPWADNNI